MEHTRPRGARPAPEPRRRTGGRSARVVDAVLRSTLEALAGGGYAALSFDDVAARARVSRTTVYRRWPTKGELVRAALLRMAEDLPQAPDTGAIRSDLLALARLKLSGPNSARDRALFRAFVAEAADPEIVTLARVVRARIQEPLVAAVERAIARGELPRGTDPRLVFEPIFAPLHLHQAIFEDAVEPGYVERLVDVVLAGARSGAAVRP
jgi:AcrR family transcriptional regulator